MTSPATIGYGARRGQDVGRTALSEALSLSPGPPFPAGLLARPPTRAFPSSYLDAFNGALASALASGAALSAAIRFANAASALACTRGGAQESLPGRDEVDRFLRSRV